jgi:SAM-dependent methyltransferase
MHISETDLDQIIYDQYADVHSSYAGSLQRPIPSGRLTQLRNFLASALPSNRSARILDVGCGDGTLLSVAVELGYTNLLGVDRADGMIAIARKRTEAKIEKHDAIEFLARLESRSVDCIVLFDVLEHIAKGDLVTLCSNLFRVLKSDGRLLLHVPNGASPYCGAVLYGDVTHKAAFTCRSIAQLLRTFGFQHVESREDAPIAHGVISFFRSILWFLIRNLAVLRIAAETGQVRGHCLTMNMFVIAKKT